MKILNSLNIDSSSCLFLDRDGVINKRLIGNYVTHPDQFEFLPGAIDGLKILNKIFHTIVVVTNQQGIGKKIFTHAELEKVHDYMLKTITNEGGRIDRIYFSDEIASENNTTRKPKTGMAEMTKKDFPQIDFCKSYVVGDSESDIQFGKNIGAITILIKTKSDLLLNTKADFEFDSLFDFAKTLS